jgi:hypothetical protein
VLFVSAAQRLSFASIFSISHVIEGIIDRVVRHLLPTGVTEVAGRGPGSEMNPRQ